MPLLCCFVFNSFMPWRERFVTKSATEWRQKPNMECKTVSMSTEINVRYFLALWMRVKKVSCVSKHIQPRHNVSGKHKQRNATQLWGWHKAAETFILTFSYRTYFSLSFRRSIVKFVPSSLTSLIGPFRSYLWCQIKALMTELCEQWKHFLSHSISKQKLFF